MYIYKMVLLSGVWANVLPSDKFHLEIIFSINERVSCDSSQVFWYFSETIFVLFLESKLGYILNIYLLL